jgi:hypothetical protein
MKSLKPAGVLGTALIVLILSAVACKKSSSTSPGGSTPGGATNTFTLNGAQASLSRMDVDTGSEGITVIAVAIFASTKDTAAITLEFTNTHSNSCGQYMGNFSDTSSAGMTVQLTYSDEITGDTYQDLGIVNNTHVQGTITSNNGTTITGTFSGTLSPVAGSATSNITVTGGTFTATL